MQPKFKRQYLPKLKTVVFITVILSVVFLVVSLVRGYQQFVAATGITPFSFLSLVFDTGTPLKVWEGRTNLLIMGIPGGDYPGRDLTDTMMVVSLNMEECCSMAIISLPRDLWSDTLKDKVNSAYYYGEEKKSGGGLTLSKAIVSDIVGLPIHYGLVVDFSGFEKMIDLVGGVTVSVPQSFTDSQFPIPGRENETCEGDPKLVCRYETLRFEAGSQLMDGVTALKYVRSRGAQGEEGSDFARSRRQQQVLVALKNKLFSPALLANPGKLSKLLVAFDRASESDLRLGELATVGKVLLKIPEERIKRISIEDELFSPPLVWYGRYVLLPKESLAAVAAYIKTQLTSEN